MNTKAPPLVRGAEGGTNVVFPKNGGVLPFPREICFEQTTKRVQELHPSGNGQTCQVAW